MVCVRVFECELNMHIGHMVLFDCTHRCFLGGDEFQRVEVKLKNGDKRKLTTKVCLANTKTWTKILGLV